jgi:cysteinyl-tRNA synthetase
MPLRLFNTLSGKVEEFQPLDDNFVRMYACGLTVYNYGHIGNFRTFVLVDVLRRFLLQSGYALKHVMNITDVDDKIIRDSSAAGLSVNDFTKKYEQAFFEDMAWLNIEKPELIARATEHIDEMAHFIHELADKDIAYKTEDGSYYFRIAKFPEYGKLSKRDFAGMEVGARVDVDEYEKDDARDFALWKAPKPGEAQWQTEIGPGRPGWHIECSVMSMKYLGDTFDLHCGGEDLIFPHHENEIAQSESLTGELFVKHWMHCRFLLVNGEKMSKSLGNFYTLRDLILMGYKPSSIRYLLASVPYRKQLNFTASPPPPPPSSACATSSCVWKPLLSPTAATPIFKSSRKTPSPKCVPASKMISTLLTFKAPSSTSSATPMPPSTPAKSAKVTSLHCSKLLNDLTISLG